MKTLRIVLLALAAVALVVLAVGEDPTRAWTDAAYLNSNAPADSGNDERPDVATDGAGHWVAVWDSDDDLGGTIGTDDDILVSRSTDDGATWSTVTYLNTNAGTDSGYDYEPEVASDGEGNWVAVWSSWDSLGGTIGDDRDILVSRSTNNGQTWTAPVALNTDAASDDGDDGSPHLATDGAGNWVVVWDSNGTLGGTIGTSPDIFVSRSTAQPGWPWTWSAPTYLNSNAPTDPDTRNADTLPRVATDGAGNWVTVWQYRESPDSGWQGEIMVARSTDNGATWTARACLRCDGNWEDEAPHLATDGAGNWLTVWESNDHLGGTIGDDYDIVGALSTDNGVSWTYPAPVNSHAASDHSQGEGDYDWDLYPDVATDSAGKWVVVWESEYGSTSDLDTMVARSTTQPAWPWTWTDAAYLNSSYPWVSWIPGPAVATDGAGHWVTVWRSEDDLGGTIGTDGDILVSRESDIPADLEKFDLFVRPFYCGDTDMDGDEATGDRVPLGLSTCCDGVDNDGNTLTDGQDPKCQPHINEDPLDDVDNDGDGYEGEDRPGVGCPWNGNDDCDTQVDEDPKNGLDDDGDDLIDEDPANGFLGIDNDRDYAVDEDGAGRFDFNGNTMIDPCVGSPPQMLCEEQFEGVDDDGDTSVDEDPLDSPAKLWIDGQPKLHEAHYLVNEVLLNNGPTSPVTAVDTTELDAPAYRADLKEDGFTTCNDNLDNDGDTLTDRNDPQCLDPHIGEEAPGLHACNDGKDNGAGWGLWDDLVDELDIDDCGTATEVSVECESPGDVISVKDGVPWYIKPPSNSPLTFQYCPEYFDPDHSNKCVPCKIPKGVGPIDMPCMMVTMPQPWVPGYCVAADSVPGVEKELELHRPVTLTTGVEVIDKHQLDVACDEWTSLHPFSIYNVLEPPEEITDPDPDNNQKGTRMLVGCTAYTHGSLSDLRGLSPPRNVYVTYADTSPVIVDANNGESSVQDFIVTLEARSPGLGIGGPEGLKDTDGDGWADNVEGMLYSDPENRVAWSTPESIHVAGSCNDDEDNDGIWGKDAGDLKCVDTDADGFSDGEEYMFGSNPLDPSKTPEHMHFPWTCYDGVDNDGDGGTASGSCDSNGCTAYPGEAEGDGPDADTWDDCSIQQLQAIRPPVMCAAGWMAAAGATYDIKIAGNGDLSVAINIPVGVPPGVAQPVVGESVFNCFQPGLYPEQEILASIRPANAHVVDLGPSEPLETSFTGEATCTGGNADLVVQDWMFGPAPSYILPIDEWEEWETQKVIYNAGPMDMDAEQVRVRKEMNVPAGSCMGYVSVGYEEETIGIAAGALYSVNQVQWYFGPAELVQDGVNLRVGDKVYVADPGGAVPETTPELSAWFLLPDAIPAYSTALAEEDMGVMCWQVGDYPFFFSNQVTLVDYPDMCDPTVGNISRDLMVEAHARDSSVTGDTDYDSFADNVECYLDTDPLDACPDKTGTGGRCPGADCDGDDAWPLDINVTKDISVTGDVFKYVGRLGAKPGMPNWLQRLDLNMSGDISVTGDVFKYVGKLGAKCT